MTGNQAATDSFGFVVPNYSNSKMDDGKAHIFTRILRKY